MLSRKPRKFDYNLSPIRPLRDVKELKDLKMGCASSQAATARGAAVAASVTEDDGTTAQASEPTKYPPAECFEIPLDDEGEQVDSIIKKHPPKRLQRLTEVPVVAPTTIEDLEQKLARAEIRRKNYLQQKIEGLASLNRSRDPDSNLEQPDAPEEQDKNQVQAPDNDGGPNGDLEGEAALPNGGSQA